MQRRDGNSSQINGGAMPELSALCMTVYASGGCCILPIPPQTQLDLPVPVWLVDVRVMSCHAVKWKVVGRIELGGLASSPLSLMFP